MENLYFLEKQRCEQIKKDFLNQIKIKEEIIEEYKTKLNQAYEENKNLSTSFNKLEIEYENTNRDIYSIKSLKDKIKDKEHREKELNKSISMIKDSNENLLHENKILESKINNLQKQLIDLEQKRNNDSREINSYENKYKDIYNIYNQTSEQLNEKIRELNNLKVKLDNFEREIINKDSIIAKLNNNINEINLNYNDLNSKFVDLELENNKNIKKLNNINCKSNKFELNKTNVFLTEMFSIKSNNSYKINKKEQKESENTIKMYNAKLQEKEEIIIKLESINKEINKSNILLIKKIKSDFMKDSKSILIEMSNYSNLNKQLSLVKKNELSNISLYNNMDTYKYNFSKLNNAKDYNQSIINTINDVEEPLEKNSVNDINENYKIDDNRLKSNYYTKLDENRLVCKNANSNILTFELQKNQEYILSLKESNFNQIVKINELEKKIKQQQTLYNSKINKLEEEVKNNNDKLDEELNSLNNLKEIEFEKVYSSEKEKYNQEIHMLNNKINELINELDICKDSYITENKKLINEINRYKQFNDEFIKDIKSLDIQNQELFNKNEALNNDIKQTIENYEYKLNEIKNNEAFNIKTMKDLEEELNHIKESENNKSLIIEKLNKEKDDLVNKYNDLNSSNLFNKSKLNELLSLLNNINDSKLNLDEYNNNNNDNENYKNSNFNIINNTKYNDYYNSKDQIIQDYKNDILKIYEENKKIASLSENLLSLKDKYNILNEENKQLEKNIYKITQDLNFHRKNEALLEKELNLFSNKEKDKYNEFSDIIKEKNIEIENILNEKNKIKEDISNLSNEFQTEMNNKSLIIDNLNKEINNLNDKSKVFENRLIMLSNQLNSSNNLINDKDEDIAKLKHEYLLLNVNFKEKISENNEKYNKLNTEHLNTSAELDKIKNLYIEIYENSKNEFYKEINERILSNNKKLEQLSSLYDKNIKYILERINIFTEEISRNLEVAKKLNSNKNKCNLDDYSVLDEKLAIVEKVCANLIKSISSISQNEAALRTIKDENANLKKINTKLKSDINDIKSEMVKVNNSSNSKSKKSMSYNSNNNSNNNNNNNKNKSNISFKNISGLDNFDYNYFLELSKIEDKEKEIVKLKIEINDLKQIKNELIQEKKEISIKLENEFNKYTNLKKENNSLIDIITNKDIEITEINKKIKLEKNRIVDEIKLLKDKMIQPEDYNCKVKKIDELNKSYMQVKEELKRKIELVNYYKSEKSLLDNTQTNNLKTEDNLVSLNNKFNKLNKEYKNKDNFNKELKSQIEVLKNKLTKQLEETNNINEKYNNLKSDNQRKEIRIKDLTEKINNIDTTSNNKNINSSNQKETNISNTDNKNSLKYLRNEIEIKSDYIKTLKNKINQKDEELLVLNNKYNKEINKNVNFKEKRLNNESNKDLNVENINLKKLVEILYNEFSKDQSNHEYDYLKDGLDILGVNEEEFNQQYLKPSNSALINALDNIKNNENIEYIINLFKNKNEFSNNLDSSSTNQINQTRNNNNNNNNNFSENNNNDKYEKFFKSIQRDQSPRQIAQMDKIFNNLKTINK